MTAAELRQRRRVRLALLFALGARSPHHTDPLVVRGVRQLLDGWAGVGRIVRGMARQGYDLQLTGYGGQGWRATFFAAGIAHSVTAAVGSGWAREPWAAVQAAARQALTRREAESARRAARRLH